MWISKRRRLGDVFLDGRGRVKLMGQAPCQPAATSIVRQHAQTTREDEGQGDMGAYLWILVELRVWSRVLVLVLVERVEGGEVARL
jgi:hypothetical protein